jgi:hypothetical protein
MKPFGTSIFENVEPVVEEVFTIRSDFDDSKILQGRGWFGGKRSAA